MQMAVFAVEEAASVVREGPGFGVDGTGLA